MDNPPRLSFPHSGWAKLAWTPPVTVPTRGPIERLLELPGVDASGSVLMVPLTCWEQPALYALLDEYGLVEAFRERCGRELRPGPLPVPPNWLGRVQLDRVDAHSTIGTRNRVASLSFPGLYPWQTDGAATALASRGLLLADEMGLGKTRTAIAAAIAHRRYLETSAPVLIVAPLFARDVWRSELEALGETDFVALRSRSLRDESWRGDARWIFVHYDVVHAWASKLTLARPCVAIVDEGHWVRNAKTQRAIGTATATARASLRIVLTGTPMDNRVGDLHHLLTLVTGSRTWGSEHDFRRRYAGMVRTEHGHQDTGPTNVNELRERMAPWYLRRTEASLPPGSLPSFRRERVTAELDARSIVEQRDLLQGVDLEKLVRAVLEGVAGEDTLRLLTSLRQVTSRAKRHATITYLETILRAGHSAVVFSWERRTAENLGHAFFDRGSAAGIDDLGMVSVLTGETTQAQRDAVVREFQTTKAPSLLSATYGVLREGVTLTKASHTVLHDLDWKLSTLLQAEKRAHRLGQRQSCTSGWVIAEDSFDAVLAKLLLRKAKWLEETLGIEAPANAAADVDLAAMVPEAEEIADWAREQLGRWVR